MKVLFIALLLVLSLQLRLNTHQDDPASPPQPPADNPLFGLTLFVQDPNNYTQEVGQVLFTDQVHFVGCNSNWANYTANTDGTFHVDGDWTSTKMACSNDRDQDITQLFGTSTKFELVKNGSATKVTLLDADGKQTLLLSWNEEESEADEPKEEQ